ncbi:hypothetical protein GS489_30820 [Rhodococcus hoagii]|nr:hypothetical protein [Prescottella equi]
MSIALTIISEAGKFSNGTITNLSSLLSLNSSRKGGNFVVHSNRAVETGSGQLFYEVFKL